MSIFPGWSSWESTISWYWGFHVAGLVLIFLLALSEILAFVYGKRADASQSIRSLAINERKNLAQRQQKDQYQPGDVKPPIPTDGGLPRAPSGENAHGYLILLVARVASLIGPS